MTAPTTGTHTLRGVSLSRRLLGTTFLSPHLFAAVLLIGLIAQVYRGDSWDDFGFVVTVIALGVYGIGFGTFLIVTAVANPPAVIDLDADMVRIGPAAIPFADVNEAFLAHFALRGRDELYLRFGGHKRRHATVVLRARRGALSESDRVVLAAMVERSGIRLPAPQADPYDPKGTFRSLDQQGFVTREQVLDAVLHTPAAGDIRRA